jgi:iron complex transport system substrate-binding protein
MPISSPSEPRPPRIASLLPGATEIVLALGLEDALVAVSHSCDFPGRVAALPRVTRTRIPLDCPSLRIDELVRAALSRGESLYEVDGDCLDALGPELVLTQGLCEVCAVGPEEIRRALPALGSAPRVLSLEPRTLEETLSAILIVGEAAGRRRTAEAVVASLRARIAAVRARTSRRRARPRVAFLEWLDPPICGGHWNPELVDIAGGVDGLGRAGFPSRTTSWEEIVAWQPEVLVVACCGYSAERTRGELEVVRAEQAFDRLPCGRTGRIHVADGVALFSRPGPSLVACLEWLEPLLA